MRTRRSKGKESLPLATAPVNYTWCLLCTGKKRTGFYTNGTLRQHYAKKHHLAVPRPVHDVLTSVLHEAEARSADGPCGDERSDSEAAPAEMRKADRPCDVRSESEAVPRSLQEAEMEEDVVLENTTSEDDYIGGGCKRSGEDGDSKAKADGEPVEVANDRYSSSLDITGSYD